MHAFVACRCFGLCTEQCDRRGSLGSSDGAILKSDVENERLNAQYENRHFDGDPYCVIPEELAIQKLYLHQAEIDSVMVSDQEVIQEVEQRIAWLADQIGSKEKMEEYYNKSYTQIREMLRENVKKSERR